MSLKAMGIPGISMSSGGKGLVSSYPLVAPKTIRPSQAGVHTFLGYVNSAGAPALDASGITEQITMEAAAPFKGIQVIIGCRAKASDNAGNPVMEFQCTAATGSDLSTNAAINGNSLTFSQKLTWPANRAKSGDSTTGRFDNTNLSTSSVAFNGEKLAVSDFIEMRSPAGVPYPSLIIRTNILPTTSGAGGTAIFKNRGANSWFPPGSWNNNAPGQKLWLRSMVGSVLNAGAVGSSFTSTTEISTHYIAGVKIYYDNGAVNYVSCGGSQASGGRDTNFKGNNLSVCAALTAATNIPHVCSFVGNGETDFRSYWEQLQEWAPVINPNIVKYPVNDIGDLYAATSQATAEAQFTTRTTRSGPARLEAYLNQYFPNCLVIFETGTPTGSGFPSIADGDLVRKAANADALANPHWAGRVIDFDAMVTDGASPRSLFASGMQGANNFHPSQAAYDKELPYVVSTILANAGYATA